MFKSALLALVVLALLAMGQAVPASSSRPSGNNSIYRKKPTPVPAGDSRPSDPPQADHYSDPQSASSTATDLATIDVLINTFRTATTGGEMVSLLLNSDKGETTAVFKLGTTTLTGGPGSCGSNADCPHDNPICSEYGYCQCASYKVGGPACSCPPTCGATTGTPNPVGQGECSSNADCPDKNPICSEYGYCQCSTYKVGGPACWTTTGDRRRRSTPVGQGECSSNADCPAKDPVCSEYGYCQCSTYVPGGPACWTTTGGTFGAPNSVGLGECSSDADCPEKNPICSEYGYCQCSTYVPGGPACSCPPTCGATFGAANPVGLGECSSNADCPDKDPICSEYGFCQCPTYVPGGPACWTTTGGTFGAPNSVGLGECSSDADCPDKNPICSEYGYCQCSSYKVGGSACSCPPTC